jgi:hypothetical protein
MLMRIALLVALLGVICSRQVAAEEHSVLTYHGDPSRSGNFVVPSLTWAKARSIHLDQTFNARVAGHTSTPSHFTGACPGRVTR